MNDSKETAADRSVAERVAVLEEAMKHVATKAWVLRGVIIDVSVTTTLAVALVKLFQ